MQGGVPFKAVDQDSSPKLPPFDAEQELLVSHSKSISNIKPYPPTMLSEEYAAAEKSISGNIESTKKTLLLDLDYTLIKSISYKRKLEELGKDREKTRHDFRSAFLPTESRKFITFTSGLGLENFSRR